MAINTCTGILSTGAAAVEKYDFGAAGLTDGVDILIRKNASGTVAGVTVIVLTNDATPTYAEWAAAGANYGQSWLLPSGVDPSVYFPTAREIAGGGKGFRYLAIIATSGNADINLYINRRDSVDPGGVAA